MDEKIKIECLIWLLIKAMGTQKAIAKAIGVRFQKINYWLNHAKSVPAKYLSKMLDLLRTHGIVPEEQNITLQDVVGLMPISQLVKWAITELARCKQPRGRKPIKNSKNNTIIQQSAEMLDRPLENTVKENIICKNFYKLNKKKKRLDQIVAEKFGFGNASTFRQAKYVLEKGCPELIAAMDDKHLSIYGAFQLAKFAVKKPEGLVAQPVENKTEVKEVAVEYTLVQRTIFEGLKSIEAHRQLSNLEIAYQLPLRKTLIGLSAQCNHKGQFVWNLAHLKTCLLLEEVPLEAVVDVLCQHQIIEKKASGKKFIGHILL